MRLLAAAFTLTSLLSIPTIASAVAEYSYTGDFFESIRDEPLPAGAYTTEMRITGSFELAWELGPDFGWSTIANEILGYSFTDGRNHLTEANSRIIEFTVATDASGNLSRWSIYIVQDLDALVGDQAGRIRVSYDSGGSFAAGVLIECLEVGAPGDSCSLIGTDAGEVHNPGPVAITTVPEPSTGALLALGLVGMVAMRRRSNAESVRLGSRS